MRTRARNCSVQHHDTCNRDALLEQVQYCEAIRCAATNTTSDEQLLTEWSSWSKCDAECGYGLEHQYRACSLLDELTEQCTLAYFSFSRPRMRRSRACFVKQCRAWLLDNTSHSAVSLALLGSMLVLLVLIVHHARPSGDN